MVAPKQIALRTFDWQRHEAFARVSGDRNPMHMDEAAARRTQAGQPVLHGVHAALWALDELARAGLLRQPVAECKVRFRELMYAGETLSVRVVSDDATRLRTEVRAGETVTVFINVTRGQLAPAESVSSGGDEVSSEGASAREWRLEDLAGQSGRCPVSTGAADLFPALAREIGNTRVGALTALSRVVGMEIPGLHSIFNSFQVRFEEGGEGATSVGFRVDDVDERFRLVNLSVNGGGVSGSVAAIARWPPVKQLSISEVAKYVKAEEFAGATVLVIGGSRGLGELAAKIVAAGGGTAVITYSVGRKDAEGVRDEIRSWGGACDPLPYDVRRPAREQISRMEKAPSHLYYFATNRIARRVDATFSDAVFMEFCRFYVAGFYDACLALTRGAKTELKVLYPSSVFVVNRPKGMTEYAMAKAAGETLCEDMNSGMPGLKVTVARLPMLPTDQTATLALIDMADPMEALLPVIREVHRP